VYIAPGKGDLEVSSDIPAPPAVVWDYLTSPTKRLRFQPGTTGMEQRNPRGRRGPGTTTHCAHGADVIVEEVLDWRPFDYFTVRFKVMGMTVQETCELSPSGDGSRVALRPKIGRSEKDRDIWTQTRDMYTGMMHEMFENLRRTITEDSAAARSDPTD
jgi:uncharacterized protein YndB with AHSA1/START domain